MATPRKAHEQFRVSSRPPDSPASKPPSTRVFRHWFLAKQFADRLRAQGFDVVVEQRLMATTPWAPCDIWDAS